MGLTKKRIPYTWDEIEDRVQAYHKDRPGKIKFIWAVQRQWEEEAHLLDCPEEHDEFTFMEMYHMLKVTVEGKAKKYATKFATEDETLKDGFYSADDFASVMWEKVWRLCKDHAPLKSGYTLYETILASLDNAVLDYLRSEHRYRKRTEDSWAKWQALNGQAVVEDASAAVDNRMLIDEMLNHPSLTEEEKTFLQVVLDYPDLSLREIAKLLGHENHMKVHRMRERIAKKLSDYKQYLYD